MSAALLNTTIADPVLRERLEKLFWAKVDKRGHDECWPWTAKSVISSLKYGALNIRGIVTGAHRVAFAIANGGIDEGAVIRHSCDNPSCCNPAHLIEGTQADNVQDMMSRGRHVKRRDSPEIRRKIAEGRAKNPPKLSPEGRARKAAATQKRWQDPVFRLRFSEKMRGANNHAYGKGVCQTPEMIAKRVSSLKANGYQHSAETKAKIAAAHRGRTSPRKGVSVSDVTRERMRAAARLRAAKTRE